MRENVSDNAKQLTRYDADVVQTLSDNIARFFTLEDNFEALYDVELDSGHYVSYNRDEFYQRNISDKLASATEFFDDLRTNIERVVYAEDQEGLYEVQNREALRMELAETDHFDHYYRINTEKGPMWLRMRAVYKDKDKKNVIIGIFNAEEEMAAKQKDEKIREELLQTNTRLFALEDTFESIYDVELETGYYDVYVRGSYYKNNVQDKLTDPQDYFKELRENIDAVVYLEDREGLYQALTKDNICQKLNESERFDYYYRLENQSGPIWYKMRVVYKDSDHKNVVIGVFNAEEEMNAKAASEAMHNEVAIRLQHEQLRAEVMSRMIDYDDDPIEMLKGYADRLRVLINCDQVIYRDLEETRIMTNSAEIAKTWSVPIDYCRQCQHFDAHHPMYVGGFTEMENCQEGWQGIPVYHECPIKSSLTRIVYCDGKVAGYLAIHYVQNYHRFTDLERKTIEEFSRILSISLSRYEAKKRAGQVDTLNRLLGMIFSLSDEFDPIMVLDAETGKYDWYQSRAQEIDALTSMSSHGDDFYKDIRVDENTIIHEEDRAAFRAFYTRENMMKVATTGEPQTTENRWRVGENNTYLWKCNKVVRMIDENGKVYVVIGVIDTTKKKEEEERLLETQAFTNFFLDSYISAYYVDLVDFSCQVYKRTDELEKEYPIIADYISSLEEYIACDVHPDDREELRKVIQPQRMREILKEQREYTYIFRDISHGVEKAYRMQVIRGADDRHAAFGFMDITTEVVEQRKRQLEVEESQKLIMSIAASYNVAYAINMKDDTFKLIRMDEEAVGPIEPFKTFDEAKTFLLMLMPPSDREWMRHELEYDTLREKLRDRTSYNLEYRVVSKGAVCWHEMIITRIDEDFIAIGAADKDLEITKKHLEDKRFDEYFALYEIDLDTEMLKIVKDSPWYEIDRAGTAIPYGPAMRKFANSLDGEAKEFFMRLADMEAIKEDLATEDKRTYAYRSNNVGDRCWVDCTIYVTLRHSDNTPAMFTFGFSMVDSLGIYRQELQQKYVEQNAILLSQQEQLEDARNAADIANKSKTNFLFNMSHDIRTPMNAIQGFTAMAKKHLHDIDKVSEYLEKIDVSGEQLLKLINQVLEMARIESGKIEFDEIPVNVLNEFNSVVTILSEQSKANGLEFISSISDIEHSYVLADEARISSITLNIVGNAMKYTPEGGSIHFKLREIAPRKPGYATFIFTVSDTGIGMSKEYLDEIYEPFSREKSSTVSKIQGTGLGLSIVKSIVDLMGGQIEVQSEPGKGTTFDITLDFEIDEKAGLREEDADDIGMISFKNKRALLVEDNEMNREIARDFLEDQGIIVEEAEDGDVAVRMLQTVCDRGKYDYYDFILMDVQMTRMGGYEATKAIRQIPAPEGIHIPIIAMTANAFEEDRQNAFAAGMDEHIAKPINIQKMYRTIAKLLYGKS